MERRKFDLLFRWFVGIGIDDAVWDASTFSKNTDRLLAGDAAAVPLAAIVAHPKVSRQTSAEHFSVDGTLVEAWALIKCFKPKMPAADAGGAPSDGPRGGDAPPTSCGRNAEVDFRGERRSNDTHPSTTDPDARLFCESHGAGAVLCFMGHMLMENRPSLVVDAELTRATGTAERVAAIAMLESVVGGTGRITVGADMGDDAAELLIEARELGVRSATTSKHHSGRNAWRNWPEGQPPKKPRSSAAC